ncbi:MAG: DUF5329 domain-containing protein [Gammaproteobacteria bacterium]|nr:DUF5329 domain-containing protein [Gammaproteobacteria bacterium]
MKPENAKQSALSASFNFMPVCFVLILALGPVDSLAASAEEEIRYLIGSVGRDGCAFIRNDRRWSRRSARDHLMSKWQLNEHLVEDAKDFIEKIASQSATSGQPYLIRCRDQQEQAARDWFSQLLSKYRAGNGS